MPKGPQGQKRPADTVSAAVMVGRIATGEAEEVGYAAAPGRRKSGEAGAAARAAKLSPDERSQIARKAAAERWKRSEDMTEQNQLLRSLFGHTEHERTHLNVKFLRGHSDDISSEDFHESVESALVQVDSGLVDKDEAFLEEGKQVAIADFIKAL